MRYINLHFTYFTYLLTKSLTRGSTDHCSTKNASNNQRVTGMSGLEGEHEEDLFCFTDVADQR